MKKSLLAFILLLALAFTLQVFVVSCDDDDDDDDSTGDDDTTDDDATDDDTAVEPPAIGHAEYPDNACMDCHADAHDGDYPDDTPDADCLACHAYVK